MEVLNSHLLTKRRITERQRGG